MLGKTKDFFLILKISTITKELNFKINIDNIKAILKISIQIKFGEKQLDFWTRKFPVITVSLPALQKESKHRRKKNNF